MSHPEMLEANATTASEFAPELSIVMPCLNEARTVGTCVQKALAYLEMYNVPGEVIVADNGSTDGSQAIAAGYGARVIAVAAKGYGNALRAGIEAARGRFVIMGDSDDSYDFLTLQPFLEKLRDGYDLVLGNRFRGGIAPGAMPRLHRFFGNPFLTLVGRTLYRNPSRDFYCGLRGFRRDAVLSLELDAVGMEFALEMLARRCRAMRPMGGQRAQRRWLARGAGAGDCPLPRHREAALFPRRRCLRQSRDVRVCRS
jgi:glycosyltransferase involved in cell wall biosynthesis